MLFMLKKTLIPFLLPPGIFIVLLVFSSVYFLFKKYWKAVIANLLIGCLMWSLSISPVSNAMLRGLESGFNVPRNPRGDVIILLGGGVYAEAPDLSGIGAPSADAIARIVTAVRIQKRLNIPVIVSAGRVFEYTSIEAPIVKRFLVDLGVPPNEIIIEDKSRDTFENTKYTGDICARAGYKNPILVTSAYHMRRAIMSFEKADMKVTPFPVGFMSSENDQYTWRDFLPRSLRDASIAIHEYLGLVFYRFAY